MKNVIKKIGVDIEARESNKKERERLSYPQEEGKKKSQVDPRGSNILNSGSEFLQNFHKSASGVRMVYA